MGVMDNGVLLALGAAAVGAVATGFASRGSMARGWDAIAAYTDFQMAWDGYLKDHRRGRGPWTTKSEARAHGSGQYDYLVESIAGAYGVSPAKVKAQIGGKSSYLAMISEGDWE